MADPNTPNTQARASLSTHSSPDRKRQTNIAAAAHRRRRGRSAMPCPTDGPGEPSSSRGGVPRAGKTKRFATRRAARRNKRGACSAGRTSGSGRDALHEQGCSCHHRGSRLRPHQAQPQRQPVARCHVGSDQLHEPGPRRRGSDRWHCRLRNTRPSFRVATKKGGHTKNYRVCRPARSRQTGKAASAARSLKHGARSAGSLEMQRWIASVNRLAKGLNRKPRHIKRQSFP
jgi:hypothetical protein